MTRPAPDRFNSEVAAPAAIRRVDRPYIRQGDLLARLDLAPDTGIAAPDFPLRAPHAFVDRIRPAAPDDPLLRQILPTSAELLEVAGYTADPVGDLASAIAPGVLKKYAGRALLIVTGACAIHCRYCFRRAYPYTGGSIRQRDLTEALAALAADPTIEEIILSGGDPLMLPNEKLAPLLEALSNIEHIRRIRIHTRIPVVMPERIDAEFLELIGAGPLPVTVVIHCNHAHEIDASVETALSALRTRCAFLLNQSVLLRGVNDSVDSLSALSLRLSEVGVLPYYLHQLDAVAGAAHFGVDDRRATELIAAVAARLPGYLVPRLVREIPGAAAKTVLHQPGDDTQPPRP